MTVPKHSGAILDINLDAITANYKLLDKKVTNATVGAVVKADAYGLGMAKVAPTLARAGCDDFFVATISEGVELRGLLKEANIHVLNGVESGTAPIFAEYKMIPLLNSLDDIKIWGNFCVEHGSPLAAGIHIDSGMSRLGLPPQELAILATNPEILLNIKLAYTMSHLACADNPEHEANQNQLDYYTKAIKRLPVVAASLANSSGIFLGPEYHFNLVRPGAALYGLSPFSDENKSPANPMAQVIRLQGKILQTRDIDTPQTVGYGATHKIGRGGRIATVAIGYAEGYPRSLSNTGCGYIKHYRLPVIGRVSMDLITLDVSAVPYEFTRPGAMVDMIGPLNPLDDVAKMAGTIGYEILTGLGMRNRRVYSTVDN